MKTTRYVGNYPRDLNGPCMVTVTTEELPINDHPSLRFTRRNARRIRRLRQRQKDRGTTFFSVPVYLVTTP